MAKYQFWGVNGPPSDSRPEATAYSRPKTEEASSKKKSKGKEEAKLDFNKGWWEEQIILKPVLAKDDGLKGARIEFSSSNLNNLRNDVTDLIRAFDNAINNAADKQDREKFSAQKAVVRSNFDLAEDHLVTYAEQKKQTREGLVDTITAITNIKSVPLCSEALKRSCLEVERDLYQAAAEQEKYLGSNFIKHTVNKWNNLKPEIDFSIPENQALVKDLQLNLHAYVTVENPALKQKNVKNVINDLAKANLGIRLKEKEIEPEPTQVVEADLPVRDAVGTDALFNNVGTVPVIQDGPQENEPHKAEIDIDKVMSGLRKLFDGDKKSKNDAQGLNEVAQGFGVIVETPQGAENKFVLTQNANAVVAAARTGNAEAVREALNLASVEMRESGDKGVRMKNVERSLENVRNLLEGKSRVAGQ